MLFRKLHYMLHSYMLGKTKAFLTNTSFVCVCVVSEQVRGCILNCGAGTQNGWKEQTFSIGWRTWTLVLQLLFSLITRLKSSRTKKAQKKEKKRAPLLLTSPDLCLA